jgi:hypothetical protein
MVHVPNDLAQAHCVRCGQVIALTEANITANPVPASSQAIQPETAIDKRSNDALSYPIPMGIWTSWGEFRSNSPAVQRELMHLATRPLPDLRTIRPLPLPDDAPDDIDSLAEALGTITIAGDQRLWTHRVLCSLFLGPGLILFVIGDPNGAITHQQYTRGVSTIQVTETDDK